MNVLQRMQCPEIELPPRRNMWNILLLIILFSALVAAGKSKSHRANRNKPLNPRIIGGSNATQTSNQHMVAVIRNGRFDCGGSIISSKYILTAAHCIIKTDKYLLRVGSLCWNKHGTLHTVGAMIAHPNYNPEESRNFDIGIMEPSPSIEFNQFVGPITLAGKNIPLPYGKVAQVSGWGATNLDPLSFPHQLQIVNLTIITNKECEKYYPGEIEDEMFCAGETDGRDACFGDSGGPLVHKGILHGVVSWGPDGNCASDAEPYGVYATVSKMRDWIDNVLS